MGLVGILRQLWRRRRLVCAGFVLALAAATVMAYRVSPGGSPLLESRQYDVGVASAAVLVDSQSSQVVDLGGDEESGVSAELGSLAGRARLLSTLMASSPLKDQIGELAGLRQGSLIARVQSTEPLSVPTPVATGTTVSAGDPEANILTLETAESIPIITINVQAASEAAAARLASSAVTELRRFMSSVAAANRVPDARQLVVAPLGKATSATVVRNSRRWFAIGAFCVVFLLWCAAIVMVSELARGWRAAARAERADALSARPGAELRPRPADAGEGPPAAPGASPTGVGWLPAPHNGVPVQSPTTRPR